MGWTGGWSGQGWFREAAGVPAGVPGVACCALVPGVACCAELGNSTYGARRCPPPPVPGVACCAELRNSTYGARRCPPVPGVACCAELSNSTYGAPKTPLNRPSTLWFRRLSAASHPEHAPCLGGYTAYNIPIWRNKQHLTPSRNKQHLTPSRNKQHLTPSLEPRAEPEPMTATSGSFPGTTPPRGCLVAPASRCPCSPC